MKGRYIIIKMNVSQQSISLEIQNEDRPVREEKGIFGGNRRRTRTNPFSVCF